MKIVFISYDFIRDGYPEMPYSIAVLIAAIKTHQSLQGFKTEHHSINLSNLFSATKNNNQEVLDKVRKQNSSLVKRYSGEASHIAIGVNAWSSLYVKDLLQKLKDVNYSGNIILGGYEITALSNQQLAIEYPEGTFFIRGYAEQVLCKILLNEICEGERFFTGTTENLKVVSPYQTKVLAPKVKAYLETKRGCPHKCGFCEWGNSKICKKTIYIDLEHVNKDLVILKKTGVEHVNVLDGTFNIGSNYTEVLRAILKLTNANITLQCHFKTLEGKKNSSEFIQLCCENKNRITLEFGVQTIIPSEELIIGRENDHEKIKSGIELLNKHKINYSVSIIYGIPGQTKESFMKTIDWLLQRNCYNIFAYPLRIARNSVLYDKRQEHNVEEGYNQDLVKTVCSSNSFSMEDLKTMTSYSNILIRQQRTIDFLDPKESLIFYILEANSFEGRYEIIEITQRLSLKLNLRLIASLLTTWSDFKPEMKEEAHEIREELLSRMDNSDYNVTALLPYFYDQAKSKRMFDQLAVIASNQEIILRIFAQCDPKNENFMKAMKAHPLTKDFDDELLYLFQMQGAWNYFDKQGNTFYTERQVIENGIILVFKNNPQTFG